MYNVVYYKELLQDQLLDLFGVRNINDYAGKEDKVVCNEDGKVYMHRINVPFCYPDGDCYTIYFIKQNNEFFFTDIGGTITKLLDGTPMEKLKKEYSKMEGKLNVIYKKYDIKDIESRLYKSIKNKDLGNTLVDFIQCIMEIVITIEINNEED